MKISLAVLVCILAFAGIADSQSAKRNTRIPSPTPSSTPQPAAKVAPTPEPSGKRNERPQNGIAAAANGSAQTTSKPSYVYEFARPDFTVPYIRIEHDEQGRGTISFKMKGLDQEQTDTLLLSTATLERIKNLMTALNFIDSTEDYQTARDYSTLGNVSITYRKDGRERTAKYNWSENKDAKALMDEYKRVSNQFVWQFDMQVARENQPLNAPSLMDALDDYLRRGEISDPKQMVPLLQELSNDERIPLIARNRAAKLIQQIAKMKN
jgi:hypothetical protein